MIASAYEIDIQENSLRRKGKLLDILLRARGSRKNIIWATDSYINLGNNLHNINPFLPKKQIKPELVTGSFGKLIQPRAAKSRDEQRKRTRDRAEVFTPLDTVEMINKSVEEYKPNKDNWKDYVGELKLEITCGEGPFIVTRYNHTAYGQLIKLPYRVGFLDKKLRTVSKYCDNESEWLKWTKKAFQSSYGYEWQGDNILLARENLLYSFIDYYKDKFNKPPNLQLQEEFAEIISWNIFQMDGIRYVVPMSCHHETTIIPEENGLFWVTPERVEKNECEGCKFNRPFKHNGDYVKVMDWSKNKAIRFVDLLNN